VNSIIARGMDVEHIRVSLLTCVGRGLAMVGCLMQGVLLTATIGMEPKDSSTLRH
jgi:hypothetical protein